MGGILTIFTRRNRRVSFEKLGIFQKRTLERVQKHLDYLSNPTTKIDNITCKNIAETTDVINNQIESFGILCCNPPRIKDYLITPDYTGVTDEKKQKQKYLEFIDSSIYYLSSVSYIFQ